MTDDIFEKRIINLLSRMDEIEKKLEEPKDISEKLKAWAFPVTLTIIGFFLVAYYNQNDKVIEAQGHIKEQLSGQSEKFITLDVKIQAQTDLFNRSINQINERLRNLEDKVNGNHFQKSNTY